MQRLGLWLLLIAACAVLSVPCSWAANAGSASAAPQLAAGSEALTSVAQVRALSTAEVAKGVPVDLHAIVTFFDPFEDIYFVQDSTGGIYLDSAKDAPALKAGDAVEVRGVTVPSFAADIQPSAIVFEHAGKLPQPAPADWHALFQRVNDCRYVSVTGMVRSATLHFASNRNEAGVVPPGVDPKQRRSFLLLDLEMDGGLLHVHIERPNGIDPLSLLDSEVRLEGVVGGIFDGKNQQLSEEIWVSSRDHMQVLRRPAADPRKLPLTDISTIMAGWTASDHSQRVHVRGSLTFYQPGLQLVVENPDGQAVLVNTYEQTPLAIGQVVDVLGFPDPHEYSEVVSQANILPTPEKRPIVPVAAGWEDALAGHYPYDLISMEGRLAAEVHERHQDTLVIQAGSHVFSAILPRTVWNAAFDQVALPAYPIGSTVRVTGVCFVYAGGPWNGERWFDLQMRTPRDVAVLALPSWWTVRRLLYLSAALLVLVAVALLWALMLQRKMRAQAEGLRRATEAEAARERRTAQLEAERGHVLEAINSTQEIEAVLLMILNLIRTQVEGSSACWCELESGEQVGEASVQHDAASPLRADILSSSGERLGYLFVAAVESSSGQGRKMLELGAKLAALAIERRRLYETLVHRSHYDQLTNAANRFLLESRLEEALQQAGRNNTRFALIYIDLDQFKQVNDLYGHRVGDIYLRQVTERFSEKLRGMDTLARVGGDEFIALIPVVRSRSEVEEIAQRLLRAFDTPFEIESSSVLGSASIGIAIYPEDGLTRDELKRVADSAMYASKSGVAD